MHAQARGTTHLPALLLESRLRLTLMSNLKTASPALALVLLAGGCGTGAEPSRPQETPPNIVWILADDLGYGDLGSYGQKRIQTPHLDRMAAEGMRFTQAYAGFTVCAPSRSVLMTGQHTGHTRVRRNGTPGLLGEDVTVAELLKEAGYATALVGKWGLGMEDSPGRAVEAGLRPLLRIPEPRARAQFLP